MRKQIVRKNLKQGIYANFHNYHCCDAAKYEHVNKISCSTSE